MARSNRHSRAIGIRAGMVALLALAASAATAAPALGISHHQANALAVKYLAPQVYPTPTALFGLPTRLKVGQHVVAWSLSPSRRRVPALVIRRRAWLYWEDLAYGAEFSHPSVLLVIDDRTGLILKRVSLDMYPLIDGRPAPFVSRTSSVSSRMLVYSSPLRVAASARAASGRLTSTGAGSNSAATTAQSATGGPITKADLKGECLVTIGDRGPKVGGNALGDQALADNMKSMENWAGSVGLNHYEAPSNPFEFRLTVYRAVTQHDCTDIFIYISGHGQAPTPEDVAAANKKIHIGAYQAVGADGNELPGGPAGIQIFAKGSLLEQPVSVQLSPYDVSTAIKTVVVGGEIITNKTTIKVGKHPNVHFKIKIDSCFSGRFADEIAKTFSIDPKKPDPKAPIRIIEYASSPWEFSWKHLPGFEVLNKDGTIKKITNPTDNPDGISEFTNANIHGLQSWAANPTKGRDLASGLQQAFSDGAAQDWARTLGISHPGAVGPGLSLGAPDDTKVSDQKIKIGSGGQTITTTTGPVTIVGGP